MQESELGGLFAAHQPSQPRYLAYCDAHGMTPEAMLEHDRATFPGGSMTGFISWVSEMKRSFKVEHPTAVAGDTIVDQEAFTEFLRQKTKMRNEADLCPELRAWLQLLPAGWFQASQCRPCPGLEDHNVTQMLRQLCDHHGLLEMYEMRCVRMSAEDGIVLLGNMLYFRRYNLASKRTEII
jgi:hypothetical protein